MSLTDMQILNGIFSLTFVIISIIIGILFILKYARYKSKLILFFGIIILTLPSSWYASSISFLIAFFSNGNGLMSFPYVYFIIGVAPLPITVFIWTVAFTDLIYQEQKNILRKIFGIMGAFIELLFFTLLLIDPKLIGQVTSPIDAVYGVYITLYQIFLVLYVLITGVLFGKASLKDENPEIRIKGKLIIIAFISFVAGAILEILSDISIIIMIIARLILISSSIEFYGGFMLPDWMKKLFLKKK